MDQSDIEATRKEIERARRYVRDIRSGQTPPHLDQLADAIETMVQELERMADFTEEELRRRCESE